MGGRLNVTDLNSTNGTYLDNQRLSPNQPMHSLDGSTIYLGNKNCAFRVQIR
jgi:pSer/pThr/pTyr-binding forkhead associated (FHA) protein